MPNRVKKILPVAVLAVAGLGISVLIEIVHRRLIADVNYVSFCNVNAQVNCDVVMGSRYASLAGVSVAIWALLYYVAMLALAVGVAVVERAQRRERLATLTLVLAVWGLLFSGYMAVIAFGVLHSICAMCSGLYLVNVGLFAAAWYLRSGVRIVGRRQAAEGLPTDRWVGIGSIAAVLVLIAVGSWEAFGRGVRVSDAASIARERPEFYRWYFAQPVVQVPADGSHARGNADAPVTIVEFSDFECGHCAAFHQTVDEVLRRVGSNTRVIFRHFPLDSDCNPKVPSRIHMQACLAAAAAECAGDQGRFWQYHDVLFDNQQQLGRDALIAYARRLGLEVTRFAACLDGSEVRQRVERDAREGAALGIDSTPTLFINGRLVKGALEADRLMDALTLARVKK